MKFEGAEARKMLKSVAEHISGRSSGHHITKMFKSENLEAAYMKAIKTRDFETATDIGIILTRM